MILTLKEFLNEKLRSNLSKVPSAFYYYNNDGLQMFVLYDRDTYKLVVNGVLTDKTEDYQGVMDSLEGFNRNIYVLLNQEVELDFDEYKDLEPKLYN